MCSELWKFKLQSLEGGPLTGACRAHSQGLGSPSPHLHYPVTAATQVRVASWQGAFLCLIFLILMTTHVSDEETEAGVEWGYSQAC